MRPVRPKTPKKPTGKLKTLKDPIEVFCRIRPLDDQDEQICVKAKDDKTVVLFPPEMSQNSALIKEVHYSFKYVFDENTTQKELFNHVCLPLIHDALQGSNGLLFTYGITSSGKTHTMTGTPHDCGLLPRTLDVIFNSIKDVRAKKFVFKPDKMNGFDVQSPAEALSDQHKELGIFNRNKGRNKREIGDWCSKVSDSTVLQELIPDMAFAVFVSYVEIYNNYIYDLLDDTPIDPKKPKYPSKMLREDEAHNMYVFGVNENEVRNAEEALEYFYKGYNKRKVSYTALNAESSRSHSVFTIRIVQAPLDPQGAEVLQDRNKLIVSQLSLVDLAGSERCVRTKNTVKNKLREAGNINTSLMLLRQCIEYLRDMQTLGITKLVPYRESKLTHLFKTFFEGEGKIKMIVCVNPQADYYDETIHVMKFAEMTQDVQILRPAPVSTPSALGLTPGRGNLYRQAIRKAREQGVPVTEVLPPTVYSLGPEFPQLIIETFDDESVYINLIDFLTARIARRNTLVQDLNWRQEEFRRNLIAFDKENIQLKQEKSVLQMDLEAREQQLRGLEQKLSSSEEILDLLQRQVDEYKRKADSASVEASEKDRMLTDQAREVERMKTKMQEKLASEKDRYRRIMERRLAAKQAELERKMCLTDEKFRQLREILNDDDWDYLGDINVPIQAIPSSTNSEASVPVTRSKKKSSTDAGEPSVETRFSKTRSATDVAQSNNGPNIQFPSQSSRNDVESIFYKENRPPNSTQGTRGIVVANPRHRRSTSTGDVWIEHKPVGNLELNTVLQPAMKKKKSVSKLEVKDVTNSDASKYVLQHQEQDSQGEVETQLFKADIIPSAGGGAQVIFNDVEKLRQVSPPPVYNLRKRSGDLPLREIEDRCTVSVECHGLPSKIMKKK